MRLNLNNLGRNNVNRALSEAVSPPPAIDRYAPKETPTVLENAAKTKRFTYFTQPGETRLLYTAESWVVVSLMLENAGPVAIGTDANLTPVLSGKGTLLPTNIIVEFKLSKGNRLYIAATAINRVTVSTAPDPQGLMLQMMAVLISIGNKTSAASEKVASVIGSVFNKLLGRG